MQEKKDHSQATAEPLERRRRRLKFRSWHRGTKELDLLLGPFADAHLDRYGLADIDLYEALLLEPDPDVYNWITGQEPIPATKDNHVLRAVVTFNHRSSSERA